MEDADETIPPNFSPKELELIRHLSEGLSSKQVADLLGISVHTVDTHRRNLLRKSRCKNTLELMVRCVRWGLV